MLRPITIEEMAALQSATVRESCERRGWPTDVVKAFLAAGVVRGPERSRSETPPRAKTWRRHTADRTARFGVLASD